MKSDKAIERDIGKMDNVSVLNTTNKYISVYLWLDKKPYSRGCTIPLVLHVFGL